MFHRSVLCACIAVVVNVCFAQKSAIDLSPSGQWDGADGPWSTFDITAGWLDRSLRGVPGVSNSILVLPAQSQDCNNATSRTCRKRATGKMHRSKSRRSAAISGLPDTTGLDSFLQDPTNNTEMWSIEPVSLGGNQIGTTNTPILRTSSADFSVGVFGLAAGTFDATGPQRPTVLSTLVGATGISIFKPISGYSLIPSYSLSYTAGSVRRNKTASLILGGYDTSKFNASTTIHCDLPSTSNDTLSLSLKAVYISGQPAPTWSLPAQSQPATFRIDSALPQIWLPLEACTAFEQAFNLTWDSKTELYLVPEAAHTKLLQANPSVSFLLGNGPEAAFKNITLSYAAFDLQLSPPVVDQTTHYFPIKRAKDASQYLLGRAFLQETYLTVDYHRRKFNLSETLFSSGFGSVIPISDAMISSDPDNNELVSSRHRNVLTTGAYIGIGISVAAFAILVATFLLAWHRGLGPLSMPLQVQDSLEKGELKTEESSIHEALEKERSELAAKQRVETMGKEIRELETVEVRELETRECHEADGAEPLVEQGGKRG